MLRQFHKLRLVGLIWFNHAYRSWARGVSNKYGFMSHNYIEIIYKQFGSKAKTGKVFMVKLHDKQYPKDKIMIHKRPSKNEYINLTTDLVPCIS